MVAWAFATRSDWKGDYVQTTNASKVDRDDLCGWIAFWRHVRRHEFATARLYNVHIDPNGGDDVGGGDRERFYRG